MDSQPENWADDTAKQSVGSQMERQAETVKEQTDSINENNRDRETDSRVERISEKLMENIVETAVADTKWADVGVKEASKGKKTARGRKKEQQLAERLAEKAVERNAERAAEKLAAEEQKGDKQMSALSKEVLIREILEEFLA